MVTTKKCPECGTEQSVTFDNCVNCGNIIKYITYPLDQNVIIEEGRIYKKCVNCGKFYYSNLNNCNHCGLASQSRLYTKQEALDEHNKEMRQIQTTEKSENTNTFSLIGTIIGITAALIMFIALFLPYCKAQAFGFSSSISYWEKIPGDGYFICFFLLIIICGFIKRIKVSNLLLSGIMLAFVFHEADRVKDSLDSDLRFMMEWGIGYYLLIICPIVMFVATLMLKKEKN